MNVSLRELRDSTGLTQKAFAEMMGIPLSTWRKWEQGESTPPKYVATLIARQLKATDTFQRKITDKKGNAYYYSPIQSSISDSRGNTIYISETLDDVNENNLIIYIDDLFEGFYDLQDKFNNDCKLDKKENIIWSDTWEEK